MAKILVMDDSYLMRAVLTNFITKEGHEVIQAKNGDEALQLYKQEKPAMVFLDIVVPEGIDGLEALKQIRLFDSFAKVVMVSSLKEHDNIKKAEENGAKGYIMKPFSKDQIKEALDKHL